MKRSLRILGCMLFLAFATRGRAVMPISPTPLPDGAAVLLSDMGAGQVTTGTIHFVVQGLLAVDSDSHYLVADLLARAVQANLVPERSVRAVFAAYGCGRDTAPSWFGCHHSLGSFDRSLRLPLPSPVAPPPCFGSGSDLFHDNEFKALSLSIDHSFGDPAVVSLVRSIPEDTLYRVEHPKGEVIVINTLPDLSPALFFTMHSWRRSPEPPNRWLALLEHLRCRAR